MVINLWKFFTPIGLMINYKINKMKASQKALEIFTTMRNCEEDNWENVGMTHDLAKKSSIIAVELIINSWEIDGNIRLDVGIINYWQEVKLELEKLYQ